MIVIVGAGLAGLSTALALAPHPCTLLCAHAPASAWAQGGIAAAIGPTDSPHLHARDTMAAGDNLCDPATVMRITSAAPGLIQTLTAAGAAFDRNPDDTIATALEAAHSRPRIVHAKDATGAEIMRALRQQLRQTPSITLIENQTAHRIVTSGGAICGLQLTSGAILPASKIVLATGGIGALFTHTTNPKGAWGQGLLLAAELGAILADLEFVQFHPTALAVGRDPMPLVSEALRGEGATLIDEHGTRFMAGQGRAELEPRDIVARAVWRHRAAGHQTYLDATHAIGADFSAHFPAIAQFCADANIDPAIQPIPIRPAAHYHMGGIAVDAQGRTSIPNLWACGECAATFLHGANRLASNSLLEAAICGQSVAASLLATDTPNAAAQPDQPHALIANPEPVRKIVSAGLGVLRDHASLSAAVETLRPIALGRSEAAGPAKIALMIALSALNRRESRGSHTRTDYPGQHATAEHSHITLPGALAPSRAAA